MQNTDPRETRMADADRDRYDDNPDGAPVDPVIDPDLDRTDMDTVDPDVDRTALDADVVTGADDDVVAARGDVPDDERAAFAAAGFGPAHALDVVLGVATYTLSTYANRLVRAPVDDELRSAAAR